MDRRRTLKILTGFALCPICKPVLAEERANPNYEGNGESAKQGDLDATNKACSAGSQQSPINIVNPIRSELPALTLNWATRADTIVNNGHTIQINFVEGSNLLLGTANYKLTQLHFHRPSEHTIAGVRFAMEAHFVHEGLNGVIAVVGVLIVPGEMNASFCRIVKTMPNTQSAPVKADPGINPNSLLPATRTYYRYPGSLTTPPCSEIVEWIILNEPIQVSASDIASFAKLFPMNARPAQKDSRRYVLLSSANIHQRAALDDN